MNVMWPPSKPDVPAPTAKSKFPPLPPPKALPEDTKKDPDVPLLVVPDENMRAPLLPDVPEFSVLTVIQLLVVVDPDPVLSESDPPVRCDPVELANDKSPPSVAVELDPEPANICTKPPRILLAVASPD